MLISHIVALHETISNFGKRKTTWTVEIFHKILEVGTTVKR